MRILRIFAFLAVILAVFTSIYPVSALPTSGSISGRVTNTSGNAVAGAAVYSDTAGVIQSQTTTAGDGRYTLTGLQAGSRHVVVEKSGYANAHLYSVNVSDNTTTQNVDFILTTQMGQLAGRVTDNGQPLANVVVLAGGIQGTGYGYDRTDHNGNYLITRLAPMGYTVNTWHPDGRSLSQDTLVYVNQTAQLNFNFSMQYPGGIRGQILLDGTLPAIHANVYIMPRDGNGTNFAGYSDAAGYYIAQSLSPDFYDVHISEVPEYPNVIWGLVPVGNRMVTLNFNLQQGSSEISGRVTDPLGQPIVGAKVQVACWNPNPCTYGEDFTDSLGEYSIPGMWAGLYNTHVDHPGYPRVVKNDVIVPAEETTVLNFAMGIPPTLLPELSTVTVFANGPNFTTRTVSIDVSSGPNVSWNASLPPNANWLFLDSNAMGVHASGLTGTDALLLQFHPENVSDGIYSTVVSLTSPDAASAQIAVTLIKNSAGYYIYLPYTNR